LGVTVLTVIVTEDDEVQPIASVTVTLYVVVISGHAVGLDTLPPGDNVAAGLQLYVIIGVPPKAVGLPPIVTHVP
jgi:hypothetical protein